MRRREDFADSIVKLSGGAAAPVDRPTLSKEYLAGNASEERVPLRPKSFYSKTPSIMKSTVAVPAFWNQHYDVPINYVGHAECWDKIAIGGDIPGKDCVVRFKRDGRTLAIASIFRDHESLQAELSMERRITQAELVSTDYAGFRQA
jgi:hypothetical protein